MNFNLPCFIPSYPIQQTAFVYVPFFQSYPTFTYQVQAQQIQTFVPQIESMHQLPQFESQELNQRRIEQPKQKETENCSNSSDLLAIISANVTQDKPTQQKEKISKSTHHLNQVQFEKESKNIQKNYAKAIASFIYKNKQLTSKILNTIEVDEFIKLIKLIKNQIQNVSHISQYTNKQDFIRAFRILGYEILNIVQKLFLKNKKQFLYIQLQNIKKEQPSQTQKINPSQSAKMLKQINQQQYSKIYF